MVPASYLLEILQSGKISNNVAGLVRKSTKNWTSEITSGRIVKCRHYALNKNIFKNNNRSSRKRCRICQELLLKTLKLPMTLLIFAVNFEHTSHIFLIFFYRILASNCCDIAYDLPFMIC